MTSSGMEDVGGSQVLTTAVACLKCNRRREKGSAHPSRLSRLACRRPSAADQKQSNLPLSAALQFPTARLSCRSAARQRTSSCLAEIPPLLPFSCCIWVPAARCEQRAWSNRVFGGWRATDDSSASRLTAKATSSCASAAGRVAACCCSPRKSSATPTGRARRSTSSTTCAAACPQRTSARASPTSARTEQIRSDRRARRLRRRAGGDAARVSPRPRHGRDDGARVPRQAGDARRARGRRHPLSRTSSTSLNHDAHPRVDRAASRRRGC